MANTEVVAQPKQSQFDLAEQLRQLFSMWEAAQVEESEAIYSEIERAVQPISKEDLQIKADGLGWFEKLCNSEIQALKVVKEEADERIEAIEERKRQIRHIALHSMKHLKLPRLKGVMYTISRRAGSDSLNIVSESQIPAQYRSIETVHTINSAAIKADLRRGKEVPGAELVRGPQGITIR